MMSNQASNPADNRVPPAGGEPAESGVRTMQAQFRVGDAVTARAIPSGFPKPMPKVEGLTVVEIKRVDSDYIPTYFRLKAVKDDGDCRFVEGAEWFFVRA